MSDQETLRQTAERLAAEKYPFGGGFDSFVEDDRAIFISGYLAGRTVSAEQIEAAARELWAQQAKGTVHPGYKFEALAPDLQDRLRDTSRAAFTAAGFTVEGES